MLQSKPATDHPKKSRWLVSLLSGILVVAVLAGALVFSINARNGAHAATIVSPPVVTIASSVNRTFKAMKGNSTIVCKERATLGHAGTSFVQERLQVKCSASVTGDVPASLLILRDNRVVKFTQTTVNTMSTISVSATFNCAAPHHSHSWGVYLVFGIRYPSGYSPTDNELSWFPKDVIFTC